jgi:hypothetical protein
VTQATESVSAEIGQRLAELRARSPAQFHVSAAASNATCPSAYRPDELGERVHTGPLISGGTTTRAETGSPTARPCQPPVRACLGATGELRPFNLIADAERDRVRIAG